MTKLNADQIAEQTTNIAAGIERIRQARDKNINFDHVKPDDLKKRLETTDDPFFYATSFDAFAPPGGVIELRVFLWNPAHPNISNNIYVHVWVGPGNIDPTVGTFLSNVDARFPRLTEPEFFGLQPGMVRVPDTSGNDPHIISLDFFLKVPAAIEESNYIGNICLLQLGGFGTPDDIGRPLSRATFVFGVLPLDRFRPKAAGEA